MSAHNFTEADLEPWAGGVGINAPREKTTSRLLWWQKQGLQQTASGYGGKLTTTRMIKFNGRMHRIYCMCYSNSGTCYFLSKKRLIFIR
jgi:hypothetical protein